MRPRIRFLLLWFAVLAALLFTSPRLRAGDCTSRSDCQDIPDNGTKAACAGGILAGACTYVRSKQKDEEKPDEGSGEASDLDTMFGSGGSDQTAPDKGGDPSQPGSDTPTSKPTGISEEARKKALRDLLNDPKIGE
jgi:hypothetical protein